MNANGSSKKLTSQSLEDFRNLFNMLGSSLESSWEAFVEDPAGTMLPMAVGALAMKYNFLTFGLTEVASFMGHVVGAGFLGSGGIQITGSNGFGGNITGGGALVLSGAGELSFAYSGEMTVEQGLAIIEGISGNLSNNEAEDLQNNRIRHKVGENGVQISSKTVWKNGKTEWLDVENPAPGKRDGRIHYYDNKYYYDIENNKFYDSVTGDLAPNWVQKLLEDEEFMKGIQKGLKFLGE